MLIKEILKVKNNNNEPVAFKVKTTAPKQYCVRPNSGRIEPHSEVEVQGNVLQRLMRIEWEWGALVGNFVKEPRLGNLHSAVCMLSRRGCLPVREATLAFPLVSTGLPKVV